MVLWEENCQAKSAIRTVKKGKNIQYKAYKAIPPPNVVWFRLVLARKTGPLSAVILNKKSISANSQGSGTNQRTNQLLTDRKRICQNRVTFQLKEIQLINQKASPIETEVKWFGERDSKSIEQETCTIHSWKATVIIKGYKWGHRFCFFFCLLPIAAPFNIPQLLEPLLFSLGLCCPLSHIALLLVFTLHFLFRISTPSFLLFSLNSSSGLYSFFFPSLTITTPNQTPPSCHQHLQNVL